MKKTCLLIALTLSASSTAFAVGETYTLTLENSTSSPINIVNDAVSGSSEGPCFYRLSSAEISKPNAPIKDIKAPATFNILGTIQPDHSRTWSAPYSVSQNGWTYYLICMARGTRGMYISIMDNSEGGWGSPKAPKPYIEYAAGSCNGVKLLGGQDLICASYSPDNNYKMSITNIFGS